MSSNNKYYTFFILSHDHAQGKSFKVPVLFLRLSILFAAFLALIALLILVDYWKLTQNFVDNKQVALENKKLREQLEIFQMKINSLANDVERIATLEQKLRTITGLDRERLTKSYFETLQLIQEKNQNQQEFQESAAPSEKSEKAALPSSSQSSPESVPRAGPPTLKAPKIPAPSLNLKPETQPEAKPEIKPATSPEPTAAPVKTSFVEQLFLSIFPVAVAQIESHWPSSPQAEVHQALASRPQLSFQQLVPDDQLFQEMLSLRVAPEQQQQFKTLEQNYTERFLRLYSLSGNYDIAQNFSGLIKRINQLALRLAQFDFYFLRLKESSKQLEEKLSGLDSYLLDKQSILNSTPVNMPTNGWITSYFGPRLNPFTGKLKMHEGIDIGAPFGAQISAPADGVVVFSGVKPGFGKHVQIDHGYGIETLYAHSEHLYVKSAAQIKRGDLLASVGSTGHSTGPHLHYEVRINGVPVDPFYFILE